MDDTTPFRTLIADGIFDADAGQFRGVLLDSLTDREVWRAPGTAADKIAAIHDAQNELMARQEERGEDRCLACGAVVSADRLRENGCVCCDRETARMLQGGGIPRLVPNDPDPVEASGTHAISPTAAVAVRASPPDARVTLPVEVRPHTPADVEIVLNGDGRVWVNVNGRCVFRSPIPHAGMPEVYVSDGGGARLGLETLSPLYLYGDLVGWGLHTGAKKLAEEFPPEAHPGAPAKIERPRPCECENLNKCDEAPGHDHAPGECGRVAGAAVTIYGTRLCVPCAKRHDADFLKR